MITGITSTCYLRKLHMEYALPLYNGIVLIEGSCRGGVIVVLSMVALWGMALLPLQRMARSVRAKVKEKQQQIKIFDPFSPPHRPFLRAARGQRRAILKQQLPKINWRKRIRHMPPRLER